MASRWPKPRKRAFWPRCSDEQARGIALRLEALDLAFYQNFRTYMLDELGQGLNTFGKHIVRLKTFLNWAELEHDLPVHRHFRKLTAPSKRG